MIKPVLRRLHSPDLYDLANDLPENPLSFSLLVQAMIGPEPGIGDESFAFIYCSPDQVEMAIEGKNILFGRGYVFAPSYDYSRLVLALESMCDGISGETWKNVAEQLNRFAIWEFEDYR